MLQYAAIALMFAASSASAQIAFSASSSTGVSPMATTLTWDAGEATRCTAGDTPGWRGDVPVAGKRNLSGIRVTLTLTLECVGGGPVRSLTWTHSGRNTDGTPATLTGYRLHYGAAPGELSEALDLPATASTYTLSIPPGRYYVAVRALSEGRDSDVSNIIEHQVGAGGTQRASILLTPVKQPDAPVLTES